MDFLHRLLNNTDGSALPERITVTAHAGSDGTEDNTIPSIEAALASGAEIVEFDLNVDESGELRLSHNAPVGGEPTFEEALVLVKKSDGIFINIDVKTTKNIDKMQEIIIKHGMLDRVFYTGIHEGFVADVKEKSPRVQYYLNCYPDTAELGNKDYCDKMVERVIGLGGIGLNINYKGVTSQLVEACHSKGLLISVWTVNSEDDMKKFLSMGADNITTEKPTFLKSIMQTKRKDIYMDYRITDFGVVPGLYELQTEKIQKVFDMCKENGGRVIIPVGTYRVGGLRMWSDTALYLESGAKLIGSDICEDYEVFPVPEGVELRTDLELISYYFNKDPWGEYRRAIISVYGGKNISIIGEEGSLIDGDDCSDPLGEEDYRGPHGIFITNVDNITLKGYRIANCGNFMHQIDNCRNITMQNLICEGGSDGVHLHHCNHILIEDCVFHTGDDNIAGINMEDLTVRRCDLNTSCDTFRAGGSHILVEDCKIWGPGIYPHRVSVVQNRGTDLVRKKSNTLPQNMGRHNLESVYIHFASANFPAKKPYHDITFRNCTVDNVDKFLHYTTGGGFLMDGAHLGEMTLENVTFTNLKGKSVVSADKDEPLMLTLKNVSATDTEGKETDVFDKNSANTFFIEK